MESESKETSIEDSQTQAFYGEPKFFIVVVSLVLGCFPLALYLAVLFCLRGVCFEHHCISFSFLAIKFCLLRERERERQEMNVQNHMQCNTMLNMWDTKWLRLQFPACQEALVRKREKRIH